MLEMTEPQVWTLIAVFGTLVIGLVTVISTLFVRVVRAEVGGLRGEMRAELRRIDDRITGLGEQMDARFATVDTKLDHLDRDVTALTKHVFGVDRD